MPAWSAPQLFAWIERIETIAARASMFELLEVPTNVDTKTVETAFLRIAAGAHPDLHRHSLPARDAERLLRAYGKVAAAYATLRDPKVRDRYRKEISERGRPITQSPVVGGSQPAVRPPSGPPPFGAITALGAATAPAIGRTPTAQSQPAVARTMTPPTIARTNTPPNVARTTTPPGAAAGRTTPPGGARAATPSSAASTAPRTAPPDPAPRTAAASTPAPNVGRTTTRTTTVAAGSETGFAGRTPTSPSRAPSRSPDGKQPLITPAAGAVDASAARPASPTPSRTKPPSRPPALSTPGSTARGDSRPPGGAITARAQIYFRKAQSCLDRGDLGGALFNLRLAAAADPTSSVIRMALAEVEAELGPKK